MLLYKDLVWKGQILMDAYIAGRILNSGRMPSVVNVIHRRNIQRDRVSGRKILLCVTLTVALGVFAQYTLLQLVH